ncbi:hypothetical protein DXG01_013618 [Tephrocybe rancida]|nr:hypothetical protein DXG01_013618 [Tephrocybe rancida]
MNVPPSSYPAVLWNYYIHYLWNYQPNSWVARIASACRVLAILVSLPIIVLALLESRSNRGAQDIASYGIARTLGVIDDVKASTSDTATVHQNVNTPAIRVIPSQSQSSTPYTDSEHEAYTAADHASHILRYGGHRSTHSEDGLAALGASQPKAFYASEGENLKLSGVGVFSPATSRPPSPVLTRKTLDQGREPGQDNIQEHGLRQRGRQEGDIAET